MCEGPDGAHGRHEGCMEGIGSMGVTWANSISGRDNAQKGK